MFLAVLGTSVQTLFVPVLRLLPDEIGATPSQVSWFITAVLLSGVVATALFGPLADRLGTRRVLFLALGLFVAGSLLGAVTSSLPWLIVARVLQGSVMATLPIGLAVLRDLVAGRPLVRGLALVAAMGSVGGGLGAVIGGVVGDYAGWRWLFVGSALLGLTAAAAVAACVPGAHRGAPGHRDLIGVLGLGAGLVLVLLPVSEGSSWGWGRPLTWAVLAGGLALLATWAWHQTATSRPFVDLRLLGTRTVLSTNVATFLIGFGMYGVILAAPQLALLPRGSAGGLGASVMDAGLISLPAIAFLGAVPSTASWLTQRWGPLVPVVSGAVAMTAGYSLLLVWSSSLAALMVATALVVVGVSFCYAGTPLLLNRDVPAGQSGEASGLNAVFRIVGTSTCSAVVTAILTTLSVAGTPTGTAFTAVFVLSGLVCFSVIPLMLVTAGTRPRRTPRRRSGASG